ncbi:MAG TPA: trypsin-like peptidase domain-containing protein [Planctomycetota bacterium]|jgi:S1-C subfamily serine protease
MYVRFVSTTCFVLLAAAAARAQEPASTPADKDPLRVHIRMHRKTAPKLVFVQGGGQSGSGVIIRSDGVILTSPTACGRRGDTATVVIPGRKQVEAKVIGRNHELELVLLKIEEKDLPVMEFADSSKARVGQIAYAFGDVFESIAADDQVAMSLGVVSGLYEVTRNMERSTYTGPVIETSAAVNPNLDGGALVDAEGKLLGLITLNYHPAKFTGLAIPAHILKPEVDKLLKVYLEGSGWIGIVYNPDEDVTTGVKILRVVDGSPADKAGIKPGDVILRVNSDRVTTGEKFESLVAGITPRAHVRFRIERDGAEQDLVVTAGSKPEKTAPKVEEKPVY